MPRRILDNLNFVNVSLALVGAFIVAGASLSVSGWHRDATLREIWLY